MYEDYLEEFVFKTAAVITEKLFGKKRPQINTQKKNEKKPAPAAAIASTQPKTDTTNQTKENANDKPTESVDVPTTPSQSEEKKEKVIETKTETETETKTEEKREIKKSEPKKAVKKVEFAVSDDEQQKHDKDQKPSTSSETNVAETKASLDAKTDGDAIVKSSSQESFELLYSQLDPEDVAMFTQKDEPEEMTEEQRLELEKAEAGKYERNPLKL